MVRLKDWWRRVRPGLFGPLLAIIVRLLGLTLRIRTEGWEAVEQLDAGRVICGWHGRSLIAAVLWRSRGYWVMISQSRDGEIQTQVFRSLGFCVIRGSSNRGGIRAAVEGIKTLREKGTMAMTPDGPRGPSGVVQEGVVFMAQKSGAYLIPVGISARKRYLTKAWDRYMVPAPFTECLMKFGEPIAVPAKSTPEEAEAIRLHLEREIHRLEALAERAMGHEPVSGSEGP